MFKSVKSKIVLGAELIMPWLVFIGGIISFYYHRLHIRYCYVEEGRNEKMCEYVDYMFHIFYYGTYFLSNIIIVAELVISIVSLAFFIKSLIYKNLSVTHIMCPRFILGILCACGAFIFKMMMIIFTTI